MQKCAFRDMHINLNRLSCRKLVSDIFYADIYVYLITLHRKALR